MKKKYFSFYYRLFFLTISFILLNNYVNAQTDSLIFYSTADTWVRSTSTDINKNYGSDTTLSVRNSLSNYMQISFLKFDLTNYTVPTNAIIDSAKIFLTMVYNQSAGGVARILSMSDANDSWDENTITWNSGRPDTVETIATQSVAIASTQLASINGISYNWNITNQVISEITDSNKILSLAVFANYNQSINIKFLSKESAIENLRPKLIIYTHTVNKNCFDFDATSDLYNNKISIQWKTNNENNIAYYKLWDSTATTPYSLIAKINNQGLSTDTIDYIYDHLNPVINSTHYYKIETVLKDSSHEISLVDSVDYGIVGMINRNEWVFTQVPSIAATKLRLKNSLDMSDFNPVGLRAQANVPLILNVQRISGTGLPKLIIGTYDRQTVTTYALTEGLNTINTTTDGDLYIKYSSDTSSNKNKIKITFLSGQATMPLYILGNSTHQEWLNQLSQDTISPNATLIANRVFIVVSKDKAIQYETSNQDTLLTYMDKILKAEDEISGLDGSTTIHQPPYYNKLMLLEKSSGNPDATSYGRVRIPTANINWILDPTYISNSGGGWGIFHEIGHHHQQSPWSWSTCTEVTVNIYSMAAKRLFHPGEQGISSSDWDNIMSYLSKPDSLKNYNSSNIENYTKLGLFHQLWLAYGDTFYQTIHKRTRNESPTPSGDAAEIRLFMLYACQISGRNLDNFFIKWGLNVAQSVYNEIDMLGYPQPEVDPSTLREDWSLKINSPIENQIIQPGIDTILISVAANGPTGIKKIEFYNGENKIGEDTSVPYKFNWINNQRGLYEIYAKVTSNAGDVIYTDTITIRKSFIQITSPAYSASIPTDSIIEIKTIVEAVDSINRVEFYNGETKIGEDSTFPYEYELQGMSNGVYNISARLIFSNGSSDTSSNVPVIVGGAFPVADAYVRDGSYDDSNYGSDSTLVIKKDVSTYNRVSYLKFDLNSYPVNNIDSIKLKLFKSKANSNVKVTQWQIWLCSEDSWNEDSITWNNKPGTDSLLATISGTSIDSVEWDLTNKISNQLNGDKVLTLAIVSTVVNATSDINFHSKESAQSAIWPQLIFKKSSIESDLTPISNVLLSATIENNGVLLNLHSDISQNTAAIVFEHSTNNKDFYSIDSQSVKNINLAGVYDYLHINPISGKINYYKVKQTDIDGHIYYSNIVSVKYDNNNSSNEWIIYPNPVINKNAVIKYKNNKNLNNINIIITDISGKHLKMVKSINNSENLIFVNLSTFAKGIYIVTIEDEKGNKIELSKKIILN